MTPTDLIAKARELAKQTWNSGLEMTEVCLPICDALEASESKLKLAREALKFYADCPFDVEMQVEGQTVTAALAWQAKKALAEIDK